MDLGERPIYDWKLKIFRELIYQRQVRLSYELYIFINFDLRVQEEAKSDFKI